MGSVLLRGYKFMMRKIAAIICLQAFCLVTISQAQVLCKNSSSGDISVSPTAKCAKGSAKAKLTKLIRPVAGPVGDTGTIGSQGKRGARGAVGPRGLPGDAGDTGNTGATGGKGAKGGKGPVGPVGATGDTGNTGDQGKIGTKGLRGDDGVVGPAGDKGDTGAQGVHGAKGPDGDRGAAGVVGSQGIKGPQGDFGAALDGCRVDSIAGLVVSPATVSLRCDAILGEFLMSYSVGARVENSSLIASLKLPPTNTIIGVTIADHFIPMGIESYIVITSNEKTASYHIEVTCCPLV